MLEKPMATSNHILPSSLLLLLLIQPQHFSNAQQPIQHLVVLVMENRSFDHIFGWRKNSTSDGLAGTECNPRSTTDVRSPTICVSDDAQYVDPDPPHGFLAVRGQVFGASGNTTPSMSGFVEAALAEFGGNKEQADTVMKGFNPSSVPIFTALAQEFAIYDRWFSSLPGPTQPNRLFVYSATSNGAVSHNKGVLIKGFPQKTIFDSMHENELDFNIYFKSAPTTLLYRNLRKLKYWRKFHKYSTFLDHARDGRLASLSVIEPRYFDMGDSPADDDHPSHDVANGQRLVKQVYETLRSSPQWNETLLVITYDEHGGFYDHVPTPNVGVPSPDGIVAPEPFNFNFDRLGVRVPTIMVSPWIKRGTVVSRPNGPKLNSEFEHSSIPATIKKMFNLNSDFLNQRDAWAGTFDDVVLRGLTEPRTDCPMTLPEVQSLRKTKADETRPISEFQSEVVQLAAVLNGDRSLSSVPRKGMTVKEADDYVNDAVTRFFRLSEEAINNGADDEAIVI